MPKLEQYSPVLLGFGSNILGNILMFGTTIFLTRVFEPAIYGEFRLIFSFMSLAVIIFLLGRDSSIIYFTQHKKNNEDLTREEFYFGVLSLLLGVVVLFVFDEILISMFFNNNVTIGYYHISIIMVPLWGIFNLILATLKSKGMINFSFIVSNLIQRLSRVPFFLIITLSGKSYYSLALGMILSQIFLIILGLRKLPFLFNIGKIKVTSFFKRLKKSLHLGFNSIIIILLTKIDILMIGNYLGNESVAIYDVCILLSFIITLPLLALVKSSEPFMRALITNRENRIKYIKDLKLSIDLSLGILLAIILSSEDILLIFGPVYSDGAVTLMILATSYGLLVLLGSPIEILNMNGFNKISSILLIITIVINVGLNYFLIPLYGIEGAGFATGTSLILGKLFGLIASRSYLHVSFIHQSPDAKIFMLFLLLLLIGTLYKSDFFSILANIFLLLLFYAYVGIKHKKLFISYVTKN